MPTNHNYRHARKTDTPCRWCIYGLMRAGAGRVQCLLWGLAAKKGHTCDAARAVMMEDRKKSWRCIIAPTTD